MTNPYQQSSSSGTEKNVLRFSGRSRNTRAVKIVIFIDPEKYTRTATARRRLSLLLYVYSLPNLTFFESFFPMVSYRRFYPPFYSTPNFLRHQQPEKKDLRVFLRNAFFGRAAGIASDGRPFHRFRPACVGPRWRGRAFFVFFMTPSTSFTLARSKFTFL